MATLDDTDLEILRLLVEAGRRPFADIADRVDLSPPAVSDRIDRLREAGVIRQFTVDVDRSTIRAGVPVLIDIVVDPADVERAHGALADHGAVEHVFSTADAHVLAQAHVAGATVRDLLAETVGTDAVEDLSVRLLDDASWTPQVGATAFAIDCAECGNTVTEEGETVTLEGDRYHFCCESCLENFVERYEELRAGADV